MTLMPLVGTAVIHVDFAELENLSTTVLAIAVHPPGCFSESLYKAFYTLKFNS